jgi:hypothetical protein
MHEQLLIRILARASDPGRVHDFAKPFRGHARIHPQATLEQITATQADLGFALPQLLQEILLKIGNGGFGPGYGLIGVVGGYADSKGEHLVELARELGALDRKILPICNWGCGIYSCLDCSKPEAPVLTFNPETHALAEENLVSVSIISRSGEVTKVRERQPQAPRPSIQTPANLQLIPHRSSFQEFISDWADGRRLWEEIE